MNIYGQLVKAKLEQLSDDLSTKGLIWYNTGSKKFKFHDGDAVRELVDTATTQTLASKTLTTPVIASIKPSASKTLTLPDVDDTLVGKATTDTLTNKTLTTPVIAQIKPTAITTLTLPAVTDTLVGKATTDTLTNKTIVAANNTITTEAPGGLVTETELNAVIAKLATLISTNSTVPVGTVIQSISTTAPAGFIATSAKTVGNTGADYSGSSYQALYNLIWSMAGVTTTAGHPFKIGSAKGASAAADWAANKLITVDFVTNEIFVRSKGSSRDLGSYQADEFKAHTHDLQGGSGGGANSNDKNSTVVGVPTIVPSDNDRWNGAKAYASGVAMTGTETRPKNVALNYYIKY